MKNIVKKGITLLAFILLVIVSIINFQGYEGLIVPVIISIIILGISVFCYQKWFKWDTTFKIYMNYKTVLAIVILFIVANLLIKKNLFLIGIQTVITVLFYILSTKSLKKENIIATFFLGIGMTFFLHDIINTFYLLISCIILIIIETLDRTESSGITALFRKKNIALITISEVFMCYLFITNFNYIIYCIFISIYLLKKERFKATLRLSYFGIILSVILLIISLFIHFPFLSTNFSLSTALLSTFTIIELLGILMIIVMDFFSKEESHTESFEKILLVMATLLSLLTKKYTFYAYPIFLIIIIIYCKKIEKLPQFIDRKVKIIDKKGLEKNLKNIKKVSAVIPNYNYENYIEERIDSVLFQSYPISELIILDDCSKDNSVEIIKKKLKEVKEKYPHLETRFIPNKTNSGNVFKQWEKCFELSTGDFLWICEADDSASPYFLEKIMKLFERDKEIVIAHTESLTMDENNNLLMKNLREWIDIFKTDKWKKSFIDDGKKFNKNYLVINNTIANVSGAVFKKKKNIPYRNFLRTAQQYKLAGDWYFYERILDYGKIAYCNQSLNYHRMHSSSVTLTTKREKEYQEICKIQDDIFSRYKTSKEVRNKVDYRRIKFRNNYGFSEEELSLANISLKDLIEKNNLKNKTLLSIIIPVYNTEPYLEKCLTSVLKEIPLNTEVIIINDGTPDNSERIIKKFMKEYKTIIKYYKKSNGGLSDTKNFGVNKAEGMYIGFVDSDDYIKPNMFDCMLKKAILDDADIVYCDVELVYENGSKRFQATTNYETKEDFMSHLDVPLMPASWSKIVKKELFKDLDYPKGYNNEDIAVSPILFGRSKKTEKVPSPFYKYFQRTGSIQNSGFSEKRFVIFKTAKICFERAKEFDKDTQEKIKGAIYTHQLMALLLFLISKEKNKTKRIKYITKFVEEINKFDDFDTNKYMIKYIKEMNYKEILLKYIKEKNIKKIDLLLKLNFLK